MSRPSFIGIGAQKSATTWIYRILSAHPEIYVPDTKELDFFSDHYSYGLQWYERFFDGADDVVTAGEFSSSYLPHPLAPQRVQKHLPDVRLIAVLRNPVERAISNHKHEIKAGRLDGDKGFASGLANNPMYLEQGLYAAHLKRWLECFSRDQMLILLTDDIHSNPNAVARRLYDFLGVSSSFATEEIQQTFNRSFAHRSADTAALKDRIYDLTRGPGSRWLWQLLTLIGARKLYRSLNVRDIDAVIPELSSAQRNELSVYFEADVRCLETLLDRDLSAWRHAERNGENKVEL